MGGLVTTQWRLHTASGEYHIELKHSHTNGMRQLSINGRVVFKLEKNTYDTGGEDLFEIEGKKGLVITKTHHHTFHYQCIYDGVELRKEAKGSMSQEKNVAPVSTSTSSDNNMNSSTSDTQTMSVVSEIGTADTKDSLGTGITAILNAALAPPQGGSSSSAANE